MIQIITAIRNERAKANKAPKEPITINILAKDETTSLMIRNTTKYLEKFTNPKELNFLNEAIEAKGMVIVVLSMATIYIPSTDLVDTEEVIKKLLATKAKLEGELQRSKKMLSNEAFVSKAPQAKIESERAKLKDYEAQYAEVLKALADLS